MSNAPATRDALFQSIADEIGWGASADDVKEPFEEVEKNGVIIVRLESLPADVQKAVLDPAINPYAPGAH